MRIFNCVLLFLASIVLVTQSVQAKEPVIVGYFAEWDIYGRNYHVDDIPGDKLTHVIYAFAKISPEGTVDLFDPYAAVEKAYLGDKWDEPLKGNFKQLILLKKKYPHLKTLIAVGGWTLSEPFSEAAFTQESREKFAKSAVDFMKQYQFDGIDIDWEFPGGGGLAKGRPEDKQNFTLFVAEIRFQLNQLEKKTGKKYLLTVASSAGDALNHYELSAVAEHIDWYNLMAYDFHGSWENQTNHQAALHANSLDTSAVAERFNVTYAVSSYLSAGVSPSQIVLGIPLYSRGWAGVSMPGSGGSGLFAKASGPSKGTWENGILDYSDVYKKVKEHSQEYIVFWDDEAKESWVFNASQEGGVFYTYEDVKTVDEKINFICTHKLRGAMFWEVSGDIRNSNDLNSIINTVHKKLQSLE